MEASLFFEQLLNGIQLGVMLFLMAAGLTLIFGIMNFLNLAHGALHARRLLRRHRPGVDGLLLVGDSARDAASATLGIILDMVVFRPLYERSHFDQVLGTFALILFFNDLVVLLWGPEPHYMAIPDWLSGSVSLSGEVSYPMYRLLIMGAGLTVAVALYALITRTRTGMLIRAGASNREMLSGLGTNVRGLSMFVFALGSAMAGFAGMISGPLIAVQVGMGDVMLIVSFLVIVIGGLGSSPAPLSRQLSSGSWTRLAVSCFRNGSATPPGPHSPPWQAMP